MKCWGRETLATIWFMKGLSNRTSKTLAKPKKTKKLIFWDPTNPRTPDPWGLKISVFGSFLYLFGFARVFEVLFDNPFINQIVARVALPNHPIFQFCTNNRNPETCKTKEKPQGTNMNPGKQQKVHYHSPPYSFENPINPLWNPSLSEIPIGIPF